MGDYDRCLRDLWSIAPVVVGHPNQHVAVEGAEGELLWVVQLGQRSGPLVQMAWVSGEESEIAFTVGKRDGEPNNYIIVFGYEPTHVNVRVVPERE